MCAREGVTVKYNSFADNSFAFSIKTPTGYVEHSHHKTFYEMFKYVKLDEIANELASLKSQGRIIREATSVDHKLSIAFINNNKLKDKIKHFEIKARLQLLECNTLLHTYHPTLYTKRCSLCNHPNDTSSHILN